MADIWKLFAVCGSFIIIIMSDCSSCAQQLKKQEYKIENNQTTQGRIQDIFLKRGVGVT